MGCGSSSQSAGGAHGPVISSQAPATVGGAASQTTANATPVVEEPKTLTPAGSSGVKFSGDIGSTAKDGSPSQPEVQTQPAPVEKEPDKRGDNVEGSKGMDDPASIEGGKARAGEETQGPPKKPEAIGGGRVAARQHKEKRPAKKPISRVATEAFSLESEKAKVRRAWAPDYRPSGIRPAGRPGAALVTGEKQTRTSLPMLLDDFPMACKTKVVCTLGPRCWSEEGIASLLDAGLDVARLNFSHGSHADHQRVLDRFRAVCGARGSSAAVLLDTKGPEIRTAMLRGGKDIDLAAGQEVTVVAVGDEYETWEGFRDEATGETRIGLSYSGLCQTVRRGSKILIADGSILVAVEEVTSSTELRGRVVSGGRLGQRKNCNLPGVRVNLPMPTTQDIRDLQQFACPNAVDYVAASFVQTADDIDSIRAFLDDSDGQSIQIIAKIENAEGLRNFDEILHRADGIMVARGDLGMEIPSEKVALAQKMMVTKANLAGKPVICATQMLGSMVEKPTPTRAEMTDVANAVFDGVDAVMLSGETASSPYFREAAATMAAIASNAETTAGARLRLAWICDFSRQPLSSMESLASSAVMAACDRGACGIIVASGGGHMAAAVSKFRPPVPIVVATCSMAICRRSRAVFGQVPCFVESLDNPEQVMEAVQIVVREIGAVSDRSLPAILVRGSGASMDADTGARLGIVQLNP
uniref:Pyruvate kinase n=1 Tax=Tetraselmis sp. GSL018 TaxID=582737 RepID=A0A061RE44_9CHLO|eukprot:CAMPEP_0177590272 /NCGR_PEP_ID=MMETSP0419_2-20121207/7300_1 /TAXON_ID=582737 /ORGANISM="Tetraselmis sp., Strain GSL018" /LENGTH=697 /DNA_ID=CAMNT_0019080785 /DNA_START=536 /DNA_END=2629 /DNA_ORIENTATION=+